MKYRVHLSRLPGGQFLVTCLEPSCTGKGATPDEALGAITAEIRFYLEHCPCTSLDDNEHVDLEVISPEGTPASPI